MTFADAAGFVVQAIIFATSAAAMWLLTDRSEKRRRAGCWIGLLGQPFWLYSTFGTQWGIFGLAVLYLYCYARGIAALTPDDNEEIIDWRPYSRLPDSAREYSCGRPAEPPRRGNANCGADRP
jgi:hypothetical protein